MSITITALNSLSDTSNNGTPTPYATTSHTPTANRLLIAYIATFVAATPIDPKAIRIVVMSSSGYTNVVAGDLGKTVNDDGAGVGILLDYNNTTRTWYINSTAAVVNGSAMTIVTGTGAGSSASDAAGEGVTGNGVTWTQKAFQNDIGATPTMRMMVYTAFSGDSPTTGAVKSIYTAAQAGQAMSIVEVDGADLSTTPNAAIVQAPKNAVAANTTMSITLASPSGGSNRFMSGFVHLATEVTAQRAFVAGTSLAWTEIHDVSFATPATGFETQKLETDQELAASASWTTSSVNAAIAIEIKAALTVTTDLVTIATGDTVTGWTTIGAAGTGAMAIEPDFYIQGTQCVSRGSNAASVLKGMSFDIGAGTTLNFSAAGAHYGKLIYIWVRMNATSVMDTRALGGLQVLVGSGATAPGATGTAYSAGVVSAWYVSGGDLFVNTDGWVCYAFDPTLPPSTSFGGGVDLTAVRWFGATVLYNTGVAKGQSFAIDAIRYGLGEVRCNGVSSTTGFRDMLDADFGTTFNRWGIVTERSGTLFVKGKLALGDGVSTAATTFTSLDESVTFENQTYWDGTRERPLIRDINPNTGLSYFGLDFRGNATGVTNVTFGAKVGTGDTASGRSGTAFIGARIKTTFDFDDGQVENVLIYGSAFRKIRGGIDMSGNAAGDEFIGNSVIQCGCFQAGPCVVRACNFIDNLGGSYRFVEDFKNDGTATQQLSTADPLADWTDRLNGANWIVPPGVEYVRLTAPASDLRQVTQRNSPDSGAGALTINVVAASGTFTRTTGSFLTDGFTIGMTVVTSGFTNAGNNATKIISSLTATVLTVTSITGLVNETGNNNERVQGSPIETALTGDHYADAIIRWPASGAAQGSLGVCFRMSATQEDYWYLKCDLVAQTVTLVRCDAGVDTTVDGPDSYAFAEDTDYLIQLVGRGTLIEGFVNGTEKVTATSSTYQSNLRVGIRGEAKTAQTGDPPRLSRFGCGANTDKLGAIAVSSADDNFKYCNFINNARAVELLTTGTYTFTEHDFSGNLVDIRDDSSGATTVNVSGTGGSPTKFEEVDDAVTTTVQTVTYTLSNLVAGSEVRIYRSSDGAALDGTESCSTTFDYAYSYAGDVAIYVHVSNVAYEWLRINDTLTNTNKTTKVFQRADRNYSNP